MTTDEMFDVIFDFDDDITCKDCPFKKECGEHELFYGCIVWEDAMGEDL